MLVRVATAAAVLAIGFGAAACSSGESTATTTPDSSETSTTVPMTIQIATPDGEASFSLDGQLPPGWPEDFPLPEGTEAAGSGSLGNQDSTVRVAVFSTSESGEAVLDFYSQEPELTTTGRSSAGANENSFGKLTLTSPYTGSVTVMSYDWTTHFIVILKGDPTSQATSTTGAGSTSTTSTTTAGAGTPQ